MRISDVSSDVCSSDLDAQPADEGRFDPELLQHRADLRPAAMDDDRVDADGLQQHDILGKVALRLRIAHRVAAIFDHESLAGVALQIRSEEHTSELQSLMRISYAVFCLKKKQKHKLTK